MVKKGEVGRRSASACWSRVVKKAVHVGVEWLRRVRSVVGQPVRVGVEWLRRVRSVVGQPVRVGVEWLRRVYLTQRQSTEAVSAVVAVYHHDVVARLK